MQHKQMKEKCVNRWKQDRKSFIFWQLDVKILGIYLTKIKMVSKPTLEGITLGKG